MSNELILQGLKTLTFSWYDAGLGWWPEAEELFWEQGALAPLLPTSG